MAEGATDWRLWLVAGVALLSLCLSGYNTWKNSKLAKEAKLNRDGLQKLDAEHRQRLIQLEEFRSTVRDPIRQTLEELPSLSRRLSAIAQTRSPIEQHENELIELNEEIAASLGAVFDAASNADKSCFADGEDWTSEVTTAQDVVAGDMNSSTNKELSIMDRLSAIGAVSVTLSELRNNINRRLDSSVASFASDSRKTPAETT